MPFTVFGMKSPPASTKTLDLAAAGNLTRQGGEIDLSRVPPTKPGLRDFFLDDAGNLWVPTRNAAGTMALFPKRNSRNWRSSSFFLDKQSEGHLKGDPHFLSTCTQGLFSKSFHKIICQMIFNVNFQTGLTNR